MCMEYLFPSLYFEPMCGLKMEVSLFYTAGRWVFLSLLRFCSSVATEGRNWRARSSVVPGTGTIKHHGELRGGAEAGNASPTVSLGNRFVRGRGWVTCGAGAVTHTSSDPGTVSFPNAMLFIFALSSVFKKKFIWNGTFCSNAKSQNQGKPSIQNYNMKRVTSHQQLHTVTTSSSQKGHKRYMVLWQRWVFFFPALLRYNSQTIKLPPFIQLSVI